MISDQALRDDGKKLLRSHAVRLLPAFTADHQIQNDEQQKQRHDQGCETELDRLE